MDYMRIYKLTEDDFDQIIESAGGKRLSVDDSREEQLNADYILDNAIIELKFVEEEGLEKQKRQQKIASIFKDQFPDRPVVILDPKLLSKEGKRNYYRAMSTPIKDHLKKAAKQLKQTALKYEGKTKVAILLNVGYGSLNHEEFKEIAFNRATNDTRQIDCLIVSGIYFYSDKFDSYITSHFEEVPINISKGFSGITKLNKCWKDFLDEFVKSAFLLNRDSLPDRLPVVEMDYEIDGVKFVKPAPLMGEPSKLWVNGRPRKNSTEQNTCPPVGLIFPKFNKENWSKFRGDGWYGTEFQKSYEEWLEFATEKRKENHNKLMPFVEIEITYDGFRKYNSTNGLHFSYLCEYASEVFQEKIHNVIHTAKEMADMQIILPEHILLLVEEIGQDKANDLSSIYHVRQSLGLQKLYPILENKKLFFEYGLALASSYAIKHNISNVIYKRDQTYMWK